jgi:hypothetical protein
MSIGGHFIAPRDLGALGASFKSSQPSLSTGAPDCPVAHQTLHSATINISLIDHFPFQMGNRLSDGGIRLSDAPSDRWLRLTWLIAAVCLHIGLSGAPREPSDEL